MLREKGSPKMRRSRKIRPSVVVVRARISQQVVATPVFKSLKQHSSRKSSSLTEKS
jgi:hypothetical protein